MVLFYLPPVAVVLFIVGAVVFAITGRGSHAEHVQMVGLAGGVICVLIYSYQGRRFQPFLDAPPPLSQQEPRSDTVLLITARSLFVVSLFLMWLCGFLLRRAGVAAVIGF